MITKQDMTIIEYSRRHFLVPGSQISLAGQPRSCYKRKEGSSNVEYDSVKLMKYNINVV